MTDHPLLYDDDGHVPQELEQRVADAIRRYPMMDSPWWLGSVAAIRVVSDWLVEVGEPSLTPNLTEGVSSDTQQTEVGEEPT
jgi:hypothetical protein